MAQLTCIVVTPEETTLESKADFVALPLFDGEIGLAPGHSPLIGRLGFGEMRVKVGDKVTRLYVDGGFVEVSGDVVSVLTNRALSANQVDAAAAQTQLKAALKMPLRSPEEEEIRERSLAQARGQLRVAQHAKRERD